MLRPARPDAAVGLVAAAAVALAFAPAAWLHALEFDREAILRGELWRLWGAHLVHFSPAQAIADALVFSLAGVFAARTLGGRNWWMGLLLAAASISLGLLWLAPDLVAYRGLSGLASATLLLAGIGIGNTRPALRPLLWWCAVALLLKTVADACGLAAGLGTLPDGVRIEWRAHALGAMVGATWWWITSRRQTPMAKTIHLQRG